MCYLWSGSAHELSGMSRGGQHPRHREYVCMYVCLYVSVRMSVCMYLSSANGGTSCYSSVRVWCHIQSCLDGRSAESICGAASTKTIRDKDAP